MKNSLKSKRRVAVTAEKYFVFVLDVGSDRSYRIISSGCSCDIREKILIVCKFRGREYENLFLRESRPSSNFQSNLRCFAINKGAEIIRPGRVITWTQFGLGKREKGWKKGERYEISIFTEINPSSRQFVFRLANFLRKILI